MSEFPFFEFSHCSFEWDEEKDRLNFTKHGIHFKTAVKVFRDPNLLIREDLEHGKEVRYNILGKEQKIFFIVCVIKEENVIRLISARLATALEKARYEYGEDNFK